MNIKHEDWSLKVELKNKKKRDDDDDYGDDCIVFSVKILWIHVTDLDG